MARRSSQVGFESSARLEVTGLLPISARYCCGWFRQEGSLVEDGCLHETGSLVLLGSLYSCRLAPGSGGLQRYGSLCPDGNLFGSGSLLPHGCLYLSDALVGNGVRGALARSLSKGDDMKWRAEIEGVGRTTAHCRVLEVYYGVARSAAPVF